MKANEGTIDRVVRLILGVALLAVALFVLEGAAAVVVGVVAFIPIITGAVGYCPLYAVAHIRTNKSSQPAAR
jgi:hypothetical protein